MPAEDSNLALFSGAVQGLQRGDFTRLAPLLEDRPLERRPCQIIEWCDKGYFAAEPAALAEAARGAAVEPVGCCSATEDSAAAAHPAARVRVVAAATPS